MQTETTLSKKDVAAAINELEDLSRAEYGLSLDELRFDADRERATLRLQRLTGILLKRRFARPRKRPAGQYSQTKAKRIWIWDRRKLGSGVRGADAESALLNRLRGPGSWNEPWPYADKEADGSVVTWEVFTDDVDSERGLFKIVTLYLKDVLSGKDRQTIAAYYRAKETEKLTRGLDLAVLLVDGVALAPIYAAVGVPSLAVGLALFLADIGAARLFAEERRPDVVA